MVSGRTTPAANLKGSGQIGQLLAAARKGTDLRTHGFADTPCLLPDGIHACAGVCSVLVGCHKGTLVHCGNAPPGHNDKYLVTVDVAKLCQRQTTHKVVAKALAADPRLQPPNP